MEIRKEEILGVPKKFILLSLLFATLIGLSSCGRIGELPFVPEATPQEWLESQPHRLITLFGSELILSKPSSTAIVYSLGILTTLIGFHFLKTRGDEKSRLWWGLALLFWGLGTFLAGTSYQAFSYEIKCAGQEFCQWTSWWEVWYMIFEVASLNAMIIAVGYTLSSGNARKNLKRYAFSNFAVYLAISLTGALIPIRFLNSFELMLLFLLPGVLLLFVTNFRGYRKNRDELSRMFLTTWISLGLIIIVYYLYMILGWTEKIWEAGFWLSDNDVLHIGLIFWMIYILIAGGKLIVDNSASKQYRRNR